MDVDDVNGINDLKLPSTSGLRRAFTTRNSTIRQVAINLPSRQITGNTIRLRRCNSEHNALLQEVQEANINETEQQAKIIVMELEQNQHLMEDNPEAEELRREALRDLAQGLTLKRHVRAKLSVSVSLRSKRKPLSFWKRCKYRLGFAWKRLKERLRDFVFSIELWYEQIRKIEGNFGSAVGSYFYFLRWLFGFNLVLLVVTVGFIVVPQALHNEEIDYEGIEPDSILDFVTGEGGLRSSLLFYGHYHTGNINTRLKYNMSFAYFFTMLCLYLLFFFVLCYKTAYSYRHNFIETAGGVLHVYANKVFSGWDFGIATEHAAALNARSIYNELKELLAEQEKNVEAISIYTKMGRYIANMILTAVVLAIIAGLQYGIWVLLSVENSDFNYWSLVLSLIITAAVCLCPVLFGFIVRLEFYAPRTALYVTLARTCLLDISTLMLLLYYWSKSNQSCWETSFGEETYRLVVLDALFSLIVLPLFEFIRAMIYKIHPVGIAPEFNIAYNSLTLIYNEAVLGFGMLFSPLLIVAVTFKFLLLFYVKREVAIHACVPARKVWRAAQTQTVMYMLVSLTIFVAMFAIGSLFFSMPSQECGPFRGYSHVFAVLTEGVLRLSENTALAAALQFVTRSGVIAFLMLFLCVFVYYMRARSLAQRSMVGILRQMLTLEAKDKDFLLSAIAKVSNGEWLYNPRDQTVSDNSHTWKYLHDENVRMPSNFGFHFDGSRLNHSLLDSSRPKSYIKERPKSKYRDGDLCNEGETDSSFSWQGSSNTLNQLRV